jgi:hypothetical protein
MIILDENLLGLRLDMPIARWYAGRVCYLTNLRPGTVIKDEAIPQLLRQYKGATFVTTNVPDFWQRILAHARYSIVCLPLPNERLHQLPELLRHLFRVREFRTRAGRMGKVIRATSAQLQYYTIGDNRIHRLPWLD